MQKHFKLLKGRFYFLSFMPIAFFLFNIGSSFGQLNGDGTETIITYDTVTVFDADKYQEVTKIVKNEVIAYVVPQFMPTFRSCKTVPVDQRGSCTKEKIGAYIDSNLIYPFELREQRTNATVIVKFVVTDDGMVSLARVAKPTNPYLDAEAVKVIEFLNRVFEDPPFYPGKANGEAVNVVMEVPVTFGPKTK